MKTKYKEKSFLIITTSLFTMAITFPFTLIYAAQSNSINDIVCGIVAFEIIILLLTIALFLLRRNTHKSDNHFPVQDDSDSIDLSNQYQNIRRKHYEQEQLLNAKKYAAVSEYVKTTLSPYMSETDITIVCNNIQSWIDNDISDILPASTDGRLTSIDLRHLAWNIGERFNWKGEKRALFIKMQFPMELKDTEVSTIRRNLRQNGKCIIKLDIPENGDYKFISE